MAGTIKTREGGLCAALAVGTLVALLAVSAAWAGKLPGAGDWSYDSTNPPTKARSGTADSADIRVYVEVTPGKPAFIYSFSAIVFSHKGTCRKDGRVKTGVLVGGDAITSLRVHHIPVRADGHFSGTRNAVGDEVGSKGTLSVKGVVDGIHMTGTVTVHMRYPVWGDCRGTAKFVRVNGVLLAG